MCLFASRVFADLGSKELQTRHAIHYGIDIGPAYSNYRSFSSLEPTRLPMRESLALRLNSVHHPRVDAV